MKHQFSKIEIGKIQESIARAVLRMVRRYPVLRNEQSDIEQDAWIKVLTSYDRARDASAQLVRDQRETDRQESIESSQYKIKGSEWSGHAKSDHAPEAFAYVVATTMALDYARNRKGKLRQHDAALSMDAPMPGAHHDEHELTLGETLAAALDSAPVVMGMADRARAVQMAIATLSDSGRDAIEAWLNDQTMTGSQRIAKMRAIESIQDQISSNL